MSENALPAQNQFPCVVQEKLAALNPGIADLEPYEFRYCLHNVTPTNGWASVALDSTPAIEQRIRTRAFYDAIQIKPRVGERIVLDENIVRLTQMLLVGLANGAYSIDWVRAHFYFDLRGFFFLTRTTYFTDAIIARFGGAPFKSFAPKQNCFARHQTIGYREFKNANAEIDQCFIDSAKKILATQGTPIILAIAGATAAGKTEIVERLRCAFEQDGQATTSIELDNFLTDREPREAKGIHSQGKAAIHFQLFKRALDDIRQGKRIRIPRYDFIDATSSHDLDGNLKPGGVPIDIEPANVIFIEGNFPFLIPEVAPLIGIKVVYLTDDPIRLKRKWLRDIDYRKKYEPTYFRNRFFKDQFLMAEIAYRPQLAMCDLAVDTTNAALWATPAMAKILA